MRCSLVQEQDNSFNYVVSRLDGTVVPDIDIGQVDNNIPWPKEKKKFTWKFLDHTPDMHASQQVKMAQVAYNSIEKICGLTIDHEPFDTKTDCTVEWLEDIAAFGGKKGVLAHAWFYHPHSSKNGVVEFNDSLESSHNFSPLGWPLEAYLIDPVHFKPGDKNSRGELRTLSTQPTLSILMHEIGHTFIGAHDKAHTESMMYPYVKSGYLGDKIQKNTFWWDDVTSIPRFQKAYGKPSRWSINRLNRWRNYRTVRSIYERK